MTAPAFTYEKREGPAEPATAQQVLDRLIEARIVKRDYGTRKLALTEFGEALVAAALTDDQAASLSHYLIRGLLDSGEPAAALPPKDAA